jgi:hypothetical protein
MERMLSLAADEELEEEVREAATRKDRTWANAYAAGIHREMCRGRLRLPTQEELEHDDDLRRKAAAITSYVMAEGSIWIKHNRFDAGIVNITFADHETDLYEHFRSLCNDVIQVRHRPAPETGERCEGNQGVHILEVRRGMVAGSRGCERREIGRGHASPTLGNGVRR